ncbi:Uncharacterised protein [uncultured Eubacterium sp.]|nr:Uncharacterised protein [uncultured Eubacterium sp.]
MTTKVKTKAIVTLLVAIMLMTIPGSVYASSLESAVVPNETLKISKETLDVTQKDIKEYDEYAEGIVEKLKSADKSEYPGIIKEYSENNSCKVKEAADSLAQSIEDSNKTVVANVDNRLEKTYEISDTESITVTPFYVAEEELYQDKASAVTTATKKSTGTIYARRTLTSWVGLKIVSVHVQCDFFYNGSKAWYKSNFDSHYERGNLSPWSCSQWSAVKEASGTSYTARARGVFCYGLQYEGNGLVIQEEPCRAQITCSKTGKITKSYTPSL